MHFTERGFNISVSRVFATFFAPLFALVVALLGGVLLSVVLPSVLAPVAPNIVLDKTTESAEEVVIPIVNQPLSPKESAVSDKPKTNLSPSIPMQPVNLPPLASSASMTMNAIAFVPASAIVPASLDIGSYSNGLSLAQVDTPPKMIHYIKPDLGQHSGQGKVMLRLVVTDTGSVANIELLSKQATPAQTKAAMAAAKKWRFKPAELRGQAVSVFVDVPITFSGS